MSSKSMVVGSIALLGFVVAGNGAAPVTTKYRIEVKAEQTVDLSAAGQGTQTTATTFAGVVRVTLTDTAGGKTLHAVIDDATFDAGPMLAITKATTDSAKGAWIHGLVDPRGKITGLKTSLDSNVVVAQLKTSMISFYPRVKPGFKAGDAWTDTTDVETKNQGANMKTRVVTNYVASPASESGAAMKLAAAFSSSVAGTMENPMAGSMDVEGTEAGTGTLLLAADGRYLGGTAHATGDMKIKTPMLPDPIPVKVVRTTTVTVVP
ncbi:MAG: hypothetical protein ABI647_12930 [Gemmatimonadota bacterium]